jgi:hypothetical protein
MVHVKPNVVISMGKGLNPHKTPTAQPFSFIIVAVIFCYSYDKIQDHYKYSRLVQYEEFVVKSGVHAAGN